MKTRAGRLQKCALNNGTSSCPETKVIEKANEYNLELL